jgi:hypothetical protein
MNKVHIEFHRVQTFRELQSSFAQLFAKNTVLLARVFNHLKLALIHPSGNSDQYKPEWIQNGSAFRRLIIGGLHDPAL